MTTKTTSHDDPYQNNVTEQLAHPAEATNAAAEFEEDLNSAWPTTIQTVCLPTWHFYHIDHQGQAEPQTASR